jgi:TRAP-type mannitol/chloroaromatic compound transport system substrate-binding protein
MEYLLNSNSSSIFSFETMSVIDELNKSVLNELPEIIFKSTINIISTMNLKIYNVLTNTNFLSDYLIDYANDNNVKQILNINIENTNKNFLQLLEQLKLNEIDGFYSPINYKSDNIFPNYIDLFNGIPFELQFRDYFNFLANKLVKKNGLDYLNEILEDYNVICLPVGLSFPAGGGWAVNEIKVSNSPVKLINYLPFKNSNIRTCGLNGEIFKKLGANVSPLGESCTYLFSNPQSDYEQEIYKLAKNYYLTGNLPPCSTIYLFLNKEKVWNNLTLQQKDELINIAYFNASNVNFQIDERQPLFLELIKKEGVKIQQLPEFLIKLMFESWLKVKIDISKTDKNGKEIIDYLNEFIEKYLLWTRISQRYQKLKFIK